MIFGFEKNQLLNNHGTDLKKQKLTRIVFKYIIKKLKKIRPLRFKILEKNHVQDVWDTR